MPTTRHGYRYLCPSCKRELRSSKRLIGKRVKCLKCLTEFISPLSAEVIRAEIEIVARHAPAPPKFAEPPPVVVNIRPQSAYISPSQLQVSGESLILFGTLAVAGSLFVFLSLSTAFLSAILIAIAYFETISHQNKLRRTATQITAGSHSALDRIVQTAARRLTMPAPSCFVVSEHEINAYAIGFDNPGTIVLNSSLLNIMNDDELMFIVGHELTHLKCGHCKYLLFTNATVGSSVNHLTSLFVDLIFKFWSRKTEFTCDRGGVVACRSPNAAMTALAKLEMSDTKTVNAFVYSAVQGSRVSDSFLSTHPETANRIAAVWHYASSHAYTYLASASQ